VSGIKRHIVVETQGLPHAVIVTAANAADRQGAIEMIAAHRENLPEVKKYLADGGYTGEKFALAVKELCEAEAAAVKRNELHKFVVLPQRRVVERTFGWLDKARRLWKNCEHTLHRSCQMLLFALIAILIRIF
jgi:transposase